MVNFRLSSLISLLVVMTALAFSQTSVSAEEFYKWQDDDGITHYTERPPANRHSVKVRASNLGAGDNDTVASDTDSDDEDNQTTTATTPLPVDPARCEAAQKNLKTLQEKSRIRVTENGNVRYLSPAEIAEQLSINQDILNNECAQ